ncbi:MAG: LacI family DNA-binding transcriptional regulator [Planctomycetota bacterium]
MSASVPSTPVGQTDSAEFDRQTARSGRTTLADVARKAGMSIGSVSDILNERVGRSYSPEAKERVHAAVRSSGYVSNRRAQMLARRQSNEIGLLFTRDFQNPYFAETIERLRQHVSAAGLVPTLELRSDWYHAGDQSVRALLADGAAGLLVGPIYSPEDLAMVNRIREMNEPVIFFGGRIDSGSDLVANDLYRGGQIAAQHALDAGHTRLAYLGPNPVGRTIEKAAGIADTLRDAGLLDGVMFHAVDFSTSVLMHGRIQDFVERWLACTAQDRPTVCLCMNDYVASAAMNAFRNAGVSLPEQLSFIGYDDITEAQYLAPPLTTVYGGADQQIQAACELIARWIRDNVPPSEQTVLEPRLVERSSVVRL